MLIRTKVTRRFQPNLKKKQNIKYIKYSTWTPSPNNTGGTSQHCWNRYLAIIMFHNFDKLIFPNRMATLLEPDDTYQRSYIFLSKQFKPLSFDPNEKISDISVDWKGTFPENDWQFQPCWQHVGNPPPTSSNHYFHKFQHISQKNMFPSTYHSNSRFE